MTFELFALLWMPTAFVLAACLTLLAVWLMERREQQPHPAE